MTTIQNPILRGFHPGPSILRVGEEFYIATSTFEWFPGVKIERSKDLKHWHPVAYPLRGQSQFTLDGVHNSCGIWGTSLSYDNGTFYLVYSIVWTRKGIFKDVHNFLITTDDIDGEWSEPVFLNSSGFDPFLFHDESGEKWLFNVNWDWRPERESFAGILAQRYDEKEKKLVGNSKVVCRGSSAGKTEGVNVYKRGDYYYMVLAEGGTGYEHRVTLARSKQVCGLYEFCPYNPIMTSRTNANNPLQRAGHASLVETEGGQWYMAYLVSRPVLGRSILGRETAIEKIRWTDNDWFVAEGGPAPRLEIPGPDSVEEQPEEKEWRYEFDLPQIPLDFQSLRVPLTSDMMSLTERPGWLRLKGWESITSQHKQTMLARRQQSFFYEIEAKMDYAPQNFRQMAGITCFYNTDNFYYLYVSGDIDGRFISVLSCQNGEFSNAESIRLPEEESVYLRVEGRIHTIQFFFSMSGETWRRVGKEFDALTLSDEYQRDGANYTGTFIGMCCQDMTGSHLHADFDWFWYSDASR